MTLAQVLSLPRWEIEAWRALFDVYGPLDWKRDDLRIARVNQYQCSDPDSLLKEFLLFRDPTFMPTEAEERNRREEALLEKFGFKPNE